MANKPAVEDHTDTDEYVSTYNLDASKVFDGMKVAFGKYVMQVVVRALVLPNGDVIRIAGVMPMKKPKKIILDS